MCLLWRYVNVYFAIMSILQITDESELSNHQAALRKWNEKNEDEKYALVITEDSTQQVTL